MLCACAVCRATAELKIAQQQHAAQIARGDKIGVALAGIGQAWRRATRVRGCGQQAAKRLDQVANLLRRALLDMDRVLLRMAYLAIVNWYTDSRNGYWDALRGRTKAALEYGRNSKKLEKKNAQ